MSCSLWKRIKQFSLHVKIVSIVLFHVNTFCTLRLAALNLIQMKEKYSDGQLKLNCHFSMLWCHSLLVTLPVPLKEETSSQQTVFLFFLSLNWQMKYFDQKKNISSIFKFANHNLCFCPIRRSIINCILLKNQSASDFICQG